jgi:hypothetical protein
VINFGYHLARVEGSAVRKAYAATLPRLVQRRVQPPRELPFEVYAYSGEAALPEQVASIRSFLRHAGRPRKFTVVSDGSYSSRSSALLRSIDPAVDVTGAELGLPPQVPTAMHQYLREHPTGKQLALIMSLPRGEAAFYVDSDVLFFEGADVLMDIARDQTAPAFYLADCGLSADERLLRTDAERGDPVNTGVLFLNSPLDWSLGIERFLELASEPAFFTNQTITHLVMHANGAGPLDAAKFVLQLDDQFIYADRHPGAGLALRHYVNPVRHKFWTALARSRA